MCTVKRMVPAGHTVHSSRAISLRQHKNWKKNLWKSVMGRRPGMTWMTFEQRERAISMLTASMSARDVAWHFQRHESTINRLQNRFQQTGNVADRPRSGRRRKITPREDRFLTTSSRHNRFLSSWKLGRLPRNTTGARVCDRTARTRLTPPDWKRPVPTLAFRWRDGFI